MSHPEREFDHIETELLFALGRLRLRAAQWLYAEVEKREGPSVANWSRRFPSRPIPQIR